MEKQLGAWLDGFQIPPSETACWPGLPMTALVWLGFIPGTTLTVLSLAPTGLTTAVPLLLFAAEAQRIPLGVYRPRAVRHAGPAAQVR